jgi:uncharacterized protein
MVTGENRILALDTVRGVAVLGILLLNIVAFAMPAPAYYNPAAYGGDTGADLVAWLVSFVLFDGKMRGLFSLLFGASMLLVIDRARARDENPARVHYSRMVWLLVFGLLHMWLVWWGDILAQYALIGMIAFAFRDMPVPRLLGLGVSLLFVQLLVTATLPLLVLGAQAAPADVEARRAVEGLATGFGVPPAAWIAEDVALHRGSWWRIAVDRFGDMRFMPLLAPLQYGWETLAYMLFGMAALRGGMLTGDWPRARYVRWAAVGLGIALPAYALIAAWIVARDFSLLAVTAGVMPGTVLVRPLAILGWASLVILLMRPGGALTMRLAAAGRMAFSNYLGTSLVCTTIFYGYGLGWYGELSRAQVYLVVLAVWAAILAWSRPWLERFAHGPLEWLWRGLSRGQLRSRTRTGSPHAVANVTQ